MFLKPIHGNFGAVDSLVINPAASGGPIADLYLLTTSLTHGMNGTELNKLMVRIEQFMYPTGVVPEYTIRLFFVLPDYRFEHFKRQNYTDALPEARRKCLEQHVLEVKTTR